jgi:hypothetical protein
VKAAVVLSTLGAVALVIALWFAWPSKFSERHMPMMSFTHRSAPAPAVIDPPFGFHWGDSMAHVEALLNYSAAEVVSRMATGAGEVWIVEGLIQPGLKFARFGFENNELRSVGLQHQYDPWPPERYRARLEELRAAFDARYGSQQPAKPISLNTEPPNASNQVGYSWKLGLTTLDVLCRTQSAPDGKKLSAGDLLISYRANEQDHKTATAMESGGSWGDRILLPEVAGKLQPEGDSVPAGSDFGITNAKLLNTSDSNQTALALQLAIKLRQEGGIDPTRATVEVNFYDINADGEILLTDAQVTYDWQSKRDWKESNPEKLTVTYAREKSAAIRSERKFYGYIAIANYDGRLESIRAEPMVLANLFPVRTFISPFETAQSAASRGDYTTAANLYRSAADRGNLFALENLAWFYARGRGVDKDYRQAAAFYERAALQNTPRSLNVLAWFLATCEDDSIRNGAESVRHATKACELTYWQEWKYIDTLSAAWAESGDFKRAIEYEQQALELKNLDENARKKLEERLAHYRKRQPVRE